MQRLWAPWRESYITKIDQQQACVFCHIFADQKKDRQNLVFIRKPHVYAVLNLYPYSNGHCLVLPNRHIGDISKLSHEEYREMMDLVRETKDLVQAVLKPQAFNIGMNLGRIAGAGIPGHVHAHVVPRWKGDHNFMPVTAQTKVISQSLTAIHKKLDDAYKSRNRRTRK